MGNFVSSYNFFLANYKASLYNKVDKPCTENQETGVMGVKIVLFVLTFKHKSSIVFLAHFNLKMIPNQLLQDQAQTHYNYIESASQICAS